MRLAYYIVATLAALAAGCRVSVAKEVVLPIAGPTYRVDCNYELANCLRYAGEKCQGRFEQVTRANCPRCGNTFPPRPQTNAAYQMPSYRGTLYFRCM